MDAIDSNLPGPRAATPPAGDPRIKQKGQGKTSRIPIKIVPIEDILRKPAWIRSKPPLISSRFYEIKRILREQKRRRACARR